MYFQKQPKTRAEQISYLKCLLGAKFKKLYPDFDTLELYLIAKNLKRKNPLPIRDYEFHQKVWVSMELSKFIKAEDNSIRGFKTKCTENFK